MFGIEYMEVDGNDIIFYVIVYDVFLDIFLVFIFFFIDVVDERRSFGKGDLFFYLDNYSLLE